MSLIPVPLAELVPVPSAPMKVSQCRPVVRVDDSSCGVCGRPGRLRRRNGVGPRLCTVCWQRARRSQANLDAPFGITVPRNIHRELDGLGLAPRTVRIYAGHIQRAEQWFADQGWYLAGAKGHQVAALSATYPETFSSRSSLRCALKAYWAIVGRSNPPLRAIRVPPQPEMTCKALSDAEARALAAAARARHDDKGLAVLLGLYQAMRRAEIADARWSRISNEAGFASLTIIGKGAKTRRIPLHRVVLDDLALRPREGDVDYFFPGQSGGACSPATIWNWIREVAAEAEVDNVRPHRLRHTCLATQNDATSDLRAVQSFAGHSRPETTSGYTRAKDTALRKVVDSLDY